MEKKYYFTVEKDGEIVEKHSSNSILYLQRIFEGFFDEHDNMYEYYWNSRITINGETVFVFLRNHTQELMEEKRKKYLRSLY